jgi:EAL domain-containing protein (putative c-di-GMP-specific phosphodiesterase class I)
MRRAGSGFGSSDADDGEALGGEIEITESALAADLDGLRNFKLDKIKIDKSFVESMSSTRESAAIVSALIGLGEGFGLTIAAEGIETSAQQAQLVRTGCEQGQGHMYCDPWSAEATAAFFAPPTMRLVGQPS